MDCDGNRQMKVEFARRLPGQSATFLIHRECIQAAHKVGRSRPHESSWAWLVGANRRHRRERFRNWDTRREAMGRSGLVFCPSLASRKSAWLRPSIIRRWIQLLVIMVFFGTNVQ